MKYKKCKHCGSEFVVWNWTNHGSRLKSIIHNFCWKWSYRPILAIKHFLFIVKQGLTRYGTECWNCSHMSFTFFKVRNGIPYDILKNTFVYLPKHQLRDDIDELNYLFYDGYKMWIQSHCKDRLNKALESIKQTIEKKIEEDGPDT